MYSWPITIVTPNVPTTHVPTSASAIVPGTPPTRTNTRTSGPVASTLASSTVRGPNRSARGPSASVPTPPANSISASRWLPWDFDSPSETSQSGTNVIRPNQATLRSAITQINSFIANGSSCPDAARAAPSFGAKPCRYDAPTISATPTTRPGNARINPPRSPKATTTAVVTSGPSPKPRLPPIENHDPARPEAHDAGRGEGRPEPEAGVAADGDPRHAARAFLAADEAGELRAFRVVGGAAQPGHEDEQQHEPVARRVRRQRDPHAGDGDARGQQPHCAAPVGPQAEERLDQRRGRLRSQDHGADGGVRKGEAVFEKREQGRQGSVREIGREMPARQQRHGAAIDVRSHGAEASED